MCYDQRRKREHRRNIGRQFSTSRIGIVLRVWQKDKDVQINSYELRDRAKDEHYYVLGEAIEFFPETIEMENHSGTDRERKVTARNVPSNALSEDSMALDRVCLENCRSRTDCRVPEERLLPTRAISIFSLKTDEVQLIETNDDAADSTHALNFRSRILSVDMTGLKMGRQWFIAKTLGLRLENFPHDLLWTVDAFDKNTRRLLEPYPSWSWASIHGKVDFQSLRGVQKSEYDLDFRRIDRGYKSKGSLGKHQQDIVKLKGFLVEVTFDSDYRKIIDPDFGPSHYLLHNVHDWSLLF
ncbi:hypothetical protein B0J14DRAFT_567573 [Halenospora varia]|nr:hypothetical protein B0J14DRAFT_567573 [Halenospora varia]